MHCKLMVLALVVASALMGCDGKQSPPPTAATALPPPPTGAATNIQPAEPAFYDLLRRRLSTNPDRKDAAEASWELVHPKTENKTDPAKKAAYINRFLTLTKSPSFGQKYCDKPTSIMKSPPVYEGNYAHVTVDVMCGAFLMRTLTDTLEKVDGKWYWVRNEINATYVDTKAGQIKANP